MKNDLTNKLHWLLLELEFILQPATVKVMCNHVHSCFFNVSFSCESHLNPEFYDDYYLTVLITEFHILLKCKLFWFLYY